LDADHPLKGVLLPRRNTADELDAIEIVVEAKDGIPPEAAARGDRGIPVPQTFFRSAKSVTGLIPARITTDGHGSYPRAVRTTPGRRVAHRTSAHKNNGLEQDHRGIKGRIRCMRGFKELRLGRALLSEL
jgi:putative transposase